MVKFVAYSSKCGQSQSGIASELTGEARSLVVSSTDGFDGGVIGSQKLDLFCDDRLDGGVLIFDDGLDGGVIGSQKLDIGVNGGSVSIELFIHDSSEFFTISG